MFYVRLRTSHYSFSIKNTCVVRSLQSFYQLRRRKTQWHLLHRCERQLLDWDGDE